MKVIEVMIALLLLVLAVVSSDAFSLSDSSTRRATVRLSGSTSLLDLSLSKPLGIILEEVVEGRSEGVFVKEVTDSGSAKQYADKIVGAKLSSVQGKNVDRVDFDTAMDAIINAPQTVKLSFIVESGVSEVNQMASFSVGDVVAVVVKQEGKVDLSINAKVGDNLRKTLLDNAFEVYQGLKQKLGNCGGGGQCTFCAVDFVESEGWEERSEYEDKKLGRFPDARLSCLNNIQGPVTLRKTAQ